MKDERGRAIIRARLRQVSVGSLGDWRSVGDGVLELRVHFGPGYRIYFGREDTDVIVLSGGEKKSQVKDIGRAKTYWKEYSTKRNA